uniref:CHHC U11-48K-type domain-containing protein n=2 Tax=Monopterus albus TaxID=43700 RepID=A0A3Q3JRI7_MONAL
MKRPVQKLLLHNDVNTTFFMNDLPAELDSHSQIDNLIDYAASETMANRITFGTTSSPCRIAAEKMGREQLEEDADQKVRWDPDKLSQCPFDKSHQIRACRLPYHLIKCRKPQSSSHSKTSLDSRPGAKCSLLEVSVQAIRQGSWNIQRGNLNHPKLAIELKTCPYNACHLVPKHELKNHVAACEDRVSVDKDDEGSVPRQQQVPVSTWVMPNMTEDWDQEADVNAAPFVWGRNTLLTPKLETRPENNLGPNVRPPNTLPWSEFKHP